MTDDGAHGETDPLHLYDPRPWVQHAACAGMPAALFFAERGQDVTNARAVCAGCPVRAECLQYALDENIGHGMWGGMSERQRRTIKRGDQPTREVEPAQRSIRHGTDGGARTHRLRGEKPCEACRQAHAQYQQEYRLRVIPGGAA